MVALEVALQGTAGRLASDDTPVVDAIATLRDLAGEHTDLLAKTAGTLLGGYLGSPMANPKNLAAAHLLVLASNGAHHDVLVTEADQVWRNAGGAAYSLR
ncbi:hypothetical protein ASD10_13250 [Aeromicrobium sp. Root472D3]|nr:hypothetical protein ASD10_13250 [Aeromicrobium sp. Root472D3]